MEGLSSTEENYLKAVYKLSGSGRDQVSTNSLSEDLQTSAASVTDMVKKLHEKSLLDYERYKGVVLTPEGERIAKYLVRKHRLWEVFLVDKLGFRWDEVHEIAEELEHIHSPELIHRLDEFLQFPTRDPHGDPIPDADGNIPFAEKRALDALDAGQSGKLVGVTDTSAEFLQYLDRLGLELGVKLEVLERIAYDRSLILQSGSEKITVSQQVAQNLMVQLVG